jgi:hypothetical protein
MKKFGKRMMAMTLAGVLTLTPITAFADGDTTPGTTEVTSEEAASGSATGAATLEGYLTDDDEVFSVTLPTSADSAIAFTLDPQNLLNTTDSDTYATKDTVLFSTKEGTSNELSITNNSQFDVDVTLETKMTGLSGSGYDIKMADNSTFKDDTSTSLYLGMTYETAAANNVKAVASTTKAVTADGLTVKVTLGGMPDNYTPKKDADSGKYTYEKTGSTDATGVAKFKMTGACNAKGDWSGLSKASSAEPKATITWTVKKHAKPSVTVSADGTVTFANLTGTANVDASKVKTSGSTTTTAAALSKAVTWDSTNWTKADGGDLILNLGSSYLTYYAGQTVTVTATLSDGTVISGSADFAAAETADAAD